ncbi:MAG: type II toxin-antitoxin system MqsA family antitoxin [Oscillospiraceae bacterium]|nr:type II toxin-antitoxin system MqsA family antitoxin [Oscillospiraceae bacterium]
MNCFMCKGELQEGTTNHVVTLESGCIVIVKNVPCLRCKQCGETYYTGTVTEQLEVILDTLETNLTEIAVVEYSRVNVA